MIGLLFHGPEVFDSGWAARLIGAMEAIDEVRCVLAGAMGRTAVIDSGLEGIQFRAEMPAACLRELAPQVDAVLFGNLAKSEPSGMVLGAMVVERAGVRVPVLQVECSGPYFVEWVEGCDRRLIRAVEDMGARRRAPMRSGSSTWEADGRVYRKMTTAAAGDFVLVDGILVGRATGAEVVLVAQNGHLIQIRGVEVKEHGIEKLDRFGGVDLAAVKLVSTPALRRTKHTARVQDSQGHGVVLVDHAGMHVYDLARDVTGVVTVGDDTTAVVGDIMYRFRIPIVGIVDGDEDALLQDGHFAPGSVRLTVAQDDEFGLAVRAAVFQDQDRVDLGFAEVRDRVLELAAPELLERVDY